MYLRPFHLKKNYFEIKNLDELKAGHVTRLPFQYPSRIQMPFENDLVLKWSLYTVLMNMPANGPNSPVIQINTCYEQTYISPKRDRKWH
jgi:hypothetical protein